MLFDQGLIFKETDDAMTTGTEGQDISSAWPTDLPGVWETQVQDEGHRADLIQDDFENMPRNWMVPAILSAIFFLPTGLVAVRNACKAKRAAEYGDHGLWRFYTGRTRFFIFLSLLLGILTYCILSVIINVVQNS